MKRKIICLTLALLMGLSLLAGCGGGSSTESGGAGGANTGSAEDGGGSAAGGEEGKIINIYVWNDEWQKKFNANYPEVKETSNDLSITYLNDGTEVHWIINPNQDGVYQQKLDEALTKQASAEADDKIDLFLAEADYILKYIDPEVDVALPIDELGISPEDVPNQYKYTQEAVTTADGKIRALSYQATPGMMVYRRSIANAVLGTDDPATVGAAVADWDKFYETADQMKAAGYYMYSGRADTYRVYSNNVSGPWVQDGNVVVDQNLMNWVNRSMEDIQSGVTHNTPGQWQDEWNKDFGPDSKVFCFFLPAWGLDVCVKPNVEGTDAAQDWAVCPAPQNFYWGGTWLIACRGTDNPEHVKDIMLKMTGDTAILRSLAEKNGEMSNDQPLMEELAQSDQFGIEMLGGQNYLGVLSSAAANISLANVSPYDQGCTEELQDAFGDYFNGKIDMDKAKANFETAIKERYPELAAGEVIWPDA